MRCSLTCTKKLLAHFCVRFAAHFCVDILCCDNIATTILNNLKYTKSTIKAKHMYNLQCKINFETLLT